AAFATLASYVIIAVGFFIVTQKFYKINYEYWKITKIFFLIFVICGIFYTLMFSGNLLFVYKVILFIIFLLTITFFVFDKKELDFIKNRFKKV
ncbi:MAG: hypothetical protein WCE54_14905, partial [Ignavibacteriaceae bacterium]